ncbi:MAG: GNAT family N-acetyltransferase [Chitinophagales bacterium]|nr:GNAT family N-acetyltransferase [Chitinophagales bacterium]
MSAAIQHLSWDSDFFGFKVGSLRTPSLTATDMQAIQEVGTKENYRLLYLVVCPVNETAVEIAEKNGAFLANTKIIYRSGIQLVHGPISANIRPYDPLNDDYVFLLELAYQSGVYSRFRLDKQIPETKFREMYQSWTQNSVNHRIADKVLVYDDNGLKGFVTVKNGPEAASIGLLGVDKHSRGMGIGGKLCDAVRKVALQHHLNYVTVPTQLENGPACTFYQKNGFEEYHREQILHLWL